MGQYYQELFADEEKVVRQRELIRLRTERNVQECGAFPAGTQVVIFGSSANGFGSPKSDLDMCLHVPNGTSIHGTDGSGAESMAILAKTFETSGMKEVDTSRLTARIPIIMYKCPDPLSASGNDCDEDLIECDLSMHNPLAVLNTSLLRSYAEITPVTRVLAAIIKRWAKARDINSPARHTLSSYGYIIMLLHFLTYHKRTGNGLISPVADPEGDANVRKQTITQATPILPNLQWLDPNWPKMPRGTPYRDSPTFPKTTMKHPMKDTLVNTHFYKPNTSNEKAMLQMLFAGQDLSLAILLATFFRYYAYEFDYKRHVVSLHSTASRGVVEREIKAEVDGWRNYSAALAIEDPFELDYDVAHVLRGGYYHRIRREFAMAYTKIADAASGRSNSSWNKGDLQSMSGKDLIDWICEPISIEREQS
jgi:terminal uridylyltransferase